MATMERDFRALVAAALPALPPGRVNWSEHPQDLSGAYVVLTLVSMVGGHTQQGPDGLWQSRIQVDCWAPGFLECLDMGHAVMAAIDGHRGGVFQAILSAGMRQTRDDDNAGEAIYRASLDFLAHWRTDHG